MKCTKCGKRVGRKYNPDEWSFMMYGDGKSVIRLKGSPTVVEHHCFNCKNK